MVAVIIMIMIKRRNHKHARANSEDECYNPHSILIISNDALSTGVTDPNPSVCANYKHILNGRSNNSSSSVSGTECDEPNSMSTNGHSSNSRQNRRTSPRPTVVIDKPPRDRVLRINRSPWSYESYRTNGNYHAPNCSRDPDGSNSRSRKNSNKNGKNKNILALLVSGLFIAKLCVFLWLFLFPLFVLTFSLITLVFMFYACFCFVLVLFAGRTQRVRIEIQKSIRM